MSELGRDFWVRQGAQIHSTANDIKRNDEALAEELGEELATIHSTFAGSASPEVFGRVINKMVQRYPLSRLDLEVRRDDTDEGVVVQTPDQAQATRRIFARADRLGRQTPYYEYRDAAMSSVGPYRPEWIKELRTVASDDAANPDVAYNSGHLMHQATFFVGPVNFYWKIGDTAFMEQMDTGDSNYITPFVPHSFASRDAGREAYIVAITFAGKLESIQQEIMVLDRGGVEDSLIDLSSPSRAFSGILRRELDNGMLALEHLSERTGLSISQFASYLDGSACPDMEALTLISQALGANLRDLLPPEAQDPREVVVQRKDPHGQWLYPSEELPHYRVQSLARSQKVPFLKGMALSVLETSPATAPTALDLSTPSHEFCYNYGTVPALLFWQGESGVRKAVLEPGGSYYLKPAIPQALRSPSPSETPEVVTMRVGASLYGDGHMELSSYPREALHRIFGETQQWYDPTKIGG